ncbi:FAD-binding oxidoreductase [Pararhizobium mangrovi]|uniref:FAD-binding oxidoreductase n=1 Tax=Pararhizobium mangrovi TaxID=2590452 RepID=A0A506U6G1_9HYPH|nr:FAD-binding oxidoreductase [Pararhizobium mangrovi]
MARGVPALVSVSSDAALPEKVDVVVIGGGIAGVATAFFLARAGVSVLVCEKGRIAGEQSSRNWGWVRQMGRDAAELPLTIESLRIWRGLHEMGVETGFRETGITYVARTARESADFEGWKRDGTAHGVPIRLLSAREVRRHLPQITDTFRTALHTGNDGRAEPAMAVPALAEAARGHGARIMTDCAVRDVETSGGRVSGVVTEHGRVACAQVLVAGGAWTRRFLGNLGVRFPQLRVIGSVARIETEHALPEMPVGGGDFAVRQRLDGGYTIARRNANIAPITPDSFAFLADFLPTYLKTWRELSVRVNRHSLDELRGRRRWHADEPSPFEACRVLDPDPDLSCVEEARKRVERAFPGAGMVRLTHAWAGVIDASPDAVPAIGPVPGREGLFVASGFSGHGFGIGPGAGRLAADLVTGGTPCVDPAPFSPSRFIRASATGAKRARQDNEAD